MILQAEPTRVGGGRTWLSAASTEAWRVPGTQGSADTAADRNVRAPGGFTLLELLMVITIIGIVASLSAPTLRALKPNPKVAATRDLLDAVGRARQLAISQRSTVYMVFVPTNFFATLPTPITNTVVRTLLEDQLTGYAFVSLRTAGDQPGMRTPRYLSKWRTLPKGAYIPTQKFTGPDFTIYTGTPINLPINRFATTNNIPFPTEDSQLAVWLPYIAFDGTGQLVSGDPGQPELIPVAEGSVVVGRDPKTKLPLAEPAEAKESPPNNTTENYSVVYIDRLTGRAHVERRRAL